MNHKDTLLNIALLGTDRKQLTPIDLPTLLAEELSIFEQSKNEAEQLLEASAMFIPFYRAGIKANKGNSQPNIAPQEQLPYSTDTANRILTEIITEKYKTLFDYWIRCCMQQKQLVQPKVLPQLLNWGGMLNRKHTHGISYVAGERGKWLAQFNSSWEYLIQETPTEDWDTASLVQRCIILSQLRSKEPAKAREKLSTVWGQENAAARVELISTLANNISKADEAFLLSLFTDKSKQVKATIGLLLRKIPDSDLLQTYERVLAESITINQSKMLGFISRTSIKIALNNISEEVFNSGIEKLSNDKKISDETFILQQLIAEVHPSFWEKHLSQNPEGVIDMFCSKEELKPFLPSLANAVVKFNVENYASLLLKTWKDAPINLLNPLSADTVIQYANRFADDDIHRLIEIIKEKVSGTWSVELTQTILKRTAEKPYLYNKQFYEEICIYLPVSTPRIAEQIKPTQEHTLAYWNTLKTDIENFITIKENIKASFKL